MTRLCIFLGIFCLGFCELRGQSADSLFMKAAIAKLQHSKEYTLEVAMLMPAAYYGFRPVKEEMTFAGQLLHLSQNLGWLSSSYLKGEKNPVGESDASLHRKDSVILVVRKAYDYALDAMQKFPVDHLKDRVSFFAGPMNELQIINLINDHQTHHRAQLLVYLRLKGIRPPEYVGW